MKDRRDDPVQSPSEETSVHVHHTAQQRSIAFPNPLQVTLVQPEKQ